jgi:ADP-heptose:LPS heptosyltransferase
MNILVIKLSALGDFFLAMPAFAAIRAHHAGARISLLTTRPLLGLARAAPWFDEVLEDARPRFWNFSGVLALRRALRGVNPAMVYDLQTSDRSSAYRRLLPQETGWSGIARGASHPHANPGRDAMHTLDRQREQLEMAGITTFPAPELGWLRGEAPTGLTQPYAVLVPGAAAGRPEKRWPAGHFAAVARALAERGHLPVIAGGPADTAVAAEVAAAAPMAVNLAGTTSLFGLAGLLGHAALVVGNDTGPMHLAAMLGVPGLVLFGAGSDPKLTAPRGPRVRVLAAPSLSALDAGQVIAALP